MSKKDHTGQRAEEGHFELSRHTSWRANAEMDVNRKWNTNSEREKVV